MSKTLKVNNTVVKGLNDKTFKVIESIMTLNPSSGDFVSNATSIDAIFPANLKDNCELAFTNAVKTVKVDLGTVRAIKAIALSKKISVEFVNGRGKGKDTSEIVPVTLG